jgi:hypothetical protein
LPEAGGLPENAALTAEPFYSHVQREYRRKIPHGKGRACAGNDVTMRNTERRGILTLAGIVVLAIIIGVVLLRLNEQPRVTPASSTGSMRGQLTPQTNPKQ